MQKSWMKMSFHLETDRSKIQLKEKRAKGDELFNLDQRMGSCCFRNKVSVISTVFGLNTTN